MLMFGGGGDVVVGVVVVEIWRERGGRLFHSCEKF